MASIKVTPVKVNEEITIKEAKSVESKMTNLLMREAQINKEISDFAGKHGSELSKIRADINEIVETVVGECRKFSPAWTHHSTSNGINMRFTPQGAVYKLDESKISKVPKGLYKKTLKYSPETDAITAFIKQNGRVPVGITANKRDGKATFTKTGDIKAKLSELQG